MRKVSAKYIECQLLLWYDSNQLWKTSSAGLQIWCHMCYHSGGGLEVREYLDASGRSPFARWSDLLNREAAAKVAAALVRMQQGNLSNAKGVGTGVFEYRIDFGPGYRIYFGKDGQQLVILVGGGTKKGQQKDIAVAKTRWQDYRQRKSAER